MHFVSNTRSNITSIDVIILIPFLCFILTILIYE
ncbi:hypothetical protein Gp_14 [Bacillus phage vB_Bacillus_1020A]|nr:hypothetical protein Gp_14 [Bacillus phage vB_Bacillus_1020A]